MLDAVFQHHRKTDNVGDLHCSPVEYFGFGRAKVQPFGPRVPECRLAIFGGGQTWHACAKGVVYRSKKARHRVIWGVGIAPTAAKSLMFDVVKANCALLSTRCFGVRQARYVPCVTAMSPLFDDAPEPSEAVVMFSHAVKSEGLRRLPGVPDMTNHNVTMKDAIRHIARGETVVTNSFHGTYWALLLGRRVICVPFNNKFLFFPDPPTVAGPEDWPDMIGKAQRYDGLLEQARALNRGFFDDVMNLP